jgi:mono/diheme cytochrome c family protein
MKNSRASSFPIRSWTCHASFPPHLGPMHLRDAPGGAQYLTADSEILERGKIVLAEHCAACHSSRNSRRYRRPARSLRPGWVFSVGDGNSDPAFE